MTFDEDNLEPYPDKDMLTHRKYDDIREDDVIEEDE